MQKAEAVRLLLNPTPRPSRRGARGRQGNPNTSRPHHVKNFARRAFPVPRRKSYNEANRKKATLHNRDISGDAREIPEGLVGPNSKSKVGREQAALSASQQQGDYPGSALGKLRREQSGTRMDYPGAGLES